MRFDYAYDHVYHMKEKRELGELKALYVKRDTPPWWGDLSLNRIGRELMIHDVDCCIHDTPPVNTAADATASLAIVLSIYDSLNKNIAGGK